MTLATQRKRHSWTDEEKEIILTRYTGTRASIHSLAAQLRQLSGEEITFNQVRKKAYRMGLVSSRWWSEKDKEKLGELITRYPIDKVAERLGRTYLSITTMASRLGYRARNRDGWYTAEEVAQILGSGGHRVQSWIKSGDLKARPHGNKQPGKNCGKAAWHIEDSDLKEFIRRHASELSGRNVDLFMVVEVLVGNIIAMENGRK